MDLQGQWVEVLGLREQAWLPFTDKSFAAGFWRGRHQDREVTWEASKFSPAGSLSMLNISLQLFISLYQRIPSCLELPWRGVEAVIVQYNNEYSAPEGTLYSPETLEHSRWKRQQSLFSWLPGNPAMWTHQVTAGREREAACDISDRDRDMGSTVVGRAAEHSWNKQSNVGLPLGLHSAVSCPRSWGSRSKPCLAFFYLGSLSALPFRLYSEFQLFSPNQWLFFINLNHCSGKWGLMKQLICSFSAY